MPIAVASAGSNDTRFSSFQKSNTNPIVNTVARPSEPSDRGTSTPRIGVVSSAASSMRPYSTQPGSRSTSLAALVMRITPSANSEVKTTPMLASSETRPKPLRAWVSRAVNIPTAIAPNTIAGPMRLPLSKNPTAIPGSTAWLIASPSKLNRRNTR